MEFFLRQVYPWLIEVSSYSSLMPLVVGLYLIRKQKNLHYRLFVFFVLTRWFIEVLGNITILIGVKNNLWIDHLTTPLEFGALAAIYYYGFKGFLYKKLILVAVVALVSFNIYAAISFEGITQMNTIPRMVSNALIIIMVVAYFCKIANDLTIVYLDKDPIFIFSCGVLIYYAGTSMSWALFNDALEVSYDAARICLSIVFVLNVLFNSWQAFILRRMAA